MCYKVKLQIIFIRVKRINNYEIHSCLHNYQFLCWKTDDVRVSRITQNARISERLQGAHRENPVRPRGIPDRRGAGVDRFDRKRAESDRHVEHEIRHKHFDAAGRSRSAGAEYRQQQRIGFEKQDVHRDHGSGKRFTTFGADRGS